MKEELIHLAKEKEFKSDLNKQDLNKMMYEGIRAQYHTVIYYLWMCELQKWLREKHSIHIQIQVLGQFVDGENKFYSQVIMFGENKWISKFVSSKLKYTYGEALEVGLQEALKLIKDETNKNERI